MQQGRSGTASRSLIGIAEAAGPERVTSVRYHGASVLRSVLRDDLFNAPPHSTCQSIQRTSGTDSSSQGPLQIFFLILKHVSGPMQGHQFSVLCE